MVEPLGLCLFYRTEKYMKEGYGVSTRGCIYQETPFCRYWEDCAVHSGIDWFASKKLMALYQSRKQEIFAKREAINRSKKMREETRRYTFGNKKKREKAT